MLTPLPSAQRSANYGNGRLVRSAGHPSKGLGIDR